MLRISIQSRETTFPSLAVGDVFKWPHTDDATLIKVNEEQALVVDKWWAPRTLTVSSVTSPAVYLGRVEWAG